MMQRTIATLAGLACLLFAVTFGCAPSATDQASNPAQPSSTTHGLDDGEHADHDQATTDGDQSSMAEKMAGLKELSPEDYQSAMKQHVCPVSGEMLGSMGAPKEVDVNGKSVWICCDGCRDKLLANPDEYLAKLDRS